LKLPITAIILTYNEEKNLPGTLEALAKLTDHILIIDSFSTDSTLQISEGYDARILQNKFETHSKQWAFALKNNPFDTEWILGLDADQILGDELIKEITTRFLKNDLTADGYYVKRKMYFLDQWIRYGGYYPLSLMKLFRKRSVSVDEGELMEHHFYINGKTESLKYWLHEANQNETLEFWLNKHIRYAKLQAFEEFTNTKDQTNTGSVFGSTSERKLFIRKKIWERMPLFIRPCLYFFYRYIIQLGFMDGKRGLIFHFLQAFWYRFTVDSMIYELRNKK
jgi:glycosyltransferase involved in cell wall biosynthesis